MSASSDQLTCPECQGTGTYVRDFTESSCKACDGTGFAHDPSITNEFIIPKRMQALIRICIKREYRRLIALMEALPAYRKPEVGPSIEYAKFAYVYMDGEVAMLDQDSDPDEVAKVLDDKKGKSLKLKKKK